jgi:hypothetical protein
LLVRLASGLGQRLLTPRNPDRGMTSINQREHRFRPFALLKSSGKVRPTADLHYPPQRNSGISYEADIRTELLRRIILSSRQVVEQRLGILQIGMPIKRGEGAAGRASGCVGFSDGQGVSAVAGASGG